MVAAKCLVFCLVVGLSQAVLFCPRERRDGTECRAKENQYKCAVFYDNLYKGEKDKLPVTWIAALPDALEGKSQDVIDDILGPDVTPASFEDKTTCEADAANAFCYATMTKLTTHNLDECEGNLINTNKADTVGNKLCDQAIRFLNGKSERWPEVVEKGLINQDIIFQFSACGSAWSEVASGSNKLVLKEPLCCKADGTFFRCDGTAFKSSCDE